MNDENYSKTQKFVLMQTIEILKSQDISNTSLKVIADACDVSERTLFRLFGSRQGLIEQLAFVLIKEVNSPEVPDELSAFPQYVEELFKSFENNRELTLVALQREIFLAILENSAKKRWLRVKATVSKHYPKLTKAEVEEKAANFRFFLGASTWNYYRTNLKLTQKQTVSAVSFALQAQLDAMGS